MFGDVLVARVVSLVVICDDVVRRTLVLIAVAEGFVFVVVIFHNVGSWCRCI